MQKRLIMRYIFVIVILFCLSFPSDASMIGKKGDKTNSVQGKVTDIHSGEELTGVLIEFIETGEKVYSDFDGTFNIQNIPDGIYDIKVYYVSYEKVLLEDVKIKKDRNRDLHIKLLPRK